MDSLTVFPPSVRQSVVSPSHRRYSAHEHRKSDWNDAISTPRKQGNAYSATDSFDSVQLHSPLSDTGDNWTTVDDITSLGLSLQTENIYNTPRKLERFDIEEGSSPRDLSYQRLDERPFGRWMRNLQKRGTGRRSTISGQSEAEKIQQEFFESPGTRRRGHQKSSSQSSSGFVAAVRSASK